MTVEVLTLADDVWAILGAVAAVNHFDGEPTIPTPTGAPGDPYWDPDGRVHAYTVFYPAAGFRSSNRVGAGLSFLDWSFQVTCVGGDRTRCLWCVDKIRSAFTGRRLTLTGGRAGRIRELGNPGPVRIAQDVAPTRAYLPLDFGVHISG